jgi:hypothetical protein
MMIGYGVGAGYSGQVSQNSGVVADKYDADNLFAGTRPQIFNPSLIPAYLGWPCNFFLCWFCCSSFYWPRLLQTAALYRYLQPDDFVLWSAVPRNPDHFQYILFHIYIGLSGIHDPAERSLPQSNEAGLYGGRFGIMQIHRMGN